MRTVDLIKRAMDSRRSISAYYDGRFRELSPYKLGLKRGAYHCLFYQYGGQSSRGPIISGSRKNWRCMILSKLKQLQILEEPLHRPNIKPWEPQTCVDTVIMEIYFD